MSRPLKTLLREYGIGISVAIGAALLIRAFLFEIYRMPSSAMLPTLEPGDTLVVVKRFGALARGQVIVYQREGSGRGVSEHIRRIVGLPGERVSVKGGQVWVDFKPQDPRPASTGTSTLPDIPEQILPPDHYFVLADHREGTRGGRRVTDLWSVVDRSQVVGVAQYLWISGEYGQIRFDRILRRIK